MRTLSVSFTVHFTNNRTVLNICSIVATGGNAVLTEQFPPTEILVIALYNCRGQNTSKQLHSTLDKKYSIQSSMRMKKAGLP